jgi:hypothetical protein
VAFWCPGTLLIDDINDIQAQWLVTRAREITKRNAAETAMVAFPEHGLADFEHGSVA